jgi:hypothetical protein
VRLFWSFQPQIQRLFDQTDILINLTASTVLRAEHLRVPVRVYLETDPVLPQIELPRVIRLIEQLGAHASLYLWGNLGAGLR